MELLFLKIKNVKKENTWVGEKLEKSMLKVEAFVKPNTLSIKSYEYLFPVAVNG